MNRCVPRPARTAASEECETTSRLLDAAERLFAEHGYDGVGMRALADEAGVNLGATTYHYGSKEKLYVETFLRRFRPANQARLELLRQAEAAAGGKPLKLEAVVDCMVRPPFQTVLQHPNFAALMARNLFMPPPFLQAVLAREMGPALQAFLTALGRSLPQVPADVILLRDLFSMGSVLMFAGKFNRLPAELRADPKAFEFVLRELVRFLAAGFQAEPAVPALDRPPLPFGPFGPPGILAT
jgi:AcrR family transcriptional regulator